MTNLRTFSSLIGCFLLLPSLAVASEPGRLNLFGHHFSVVAGAKVFVPQEQKTRDVFGTAHVDPDFRLWHFDDPKRPSLAWDLGWTRFEQNNTAADFISAGIGVRFVMATADQHVVPYAAVRGGPYFARVPRFKRTTVAGGNAELGLSILDRVVVSARYDLLGRVRGYRLSGYTGRLGIRIF